MTPKDIADIIEIMSRAPLQNIKEAQAVSALMDRLVQHFRPAPPEIGSETVNP